MLISTVQNEENEIPWMPCPKVNTEIPGLAFICPLDQLIVAEKRDALHDIIGVNGIAYTIFNSGGEKVFLAVIKKKFRHFNVKIFNIYGNEIINVERPFTYWANRVQVWSPPGNYIGSVKEKKCCVNTYEVTNQQGKHVLKIIPEGGGGLEYLYKIYLLYGGTAIGVIKKEFPLTTLVDVKNFGVSFPADLDVRDKAVLLGACFLIGCLKY